MLEVELHKFSGSLLPGFPLLLQVGMRLTISQDHNGGSREAIKVGIPGSQPSS